MKSEALPKAMITLDYTQLLNPGPGKNYHLLVIATVIKLL